MYADLIQLSAEVKDTFYKPQFSLILFHFRSFVCFQISWKWRITVWLELFGNKGSVPWVLLCENAFIVLRNHYVLNGIAEIQHLESFVCSSFFFKVFLQCKLHAHTKLLCIWCQKINLAGCSVCFCLHGYSQSDHKETVFLPFYI